jgi:UDP-N-acetylglucosamine 2-epimerase (non-hydrolysing)
MRLRNGIIVRLSVLIARLKKSKRFLYTPIWPEYSQVIEFYSSPSCLAAYTDSGGLQEELNMLQKICLTCRFNTDRPETVREGHGNLLIPPISADFIASAIDYVFKNKRLSETLRQARPLYGTKVGEKFIHVLQQLMKKNEKSFLWAHERLGFWQEPRQKHPFL